MSTPELTKTEQIKEQVRQDWTSEAASWRKWKSQQEMQGRAATQILLRVARVKPGMQVLDLASGAGEPALALAELAGQGGQVTATDLVPDMLAVAEECARERGLTNMSFQQADAEALPFPDQAFDVVTCRLGVMFFPNVGKALQEVYRVLKPGGRAAFIAHGPLEKNTWRSIEGRVLRKYVQMAPPEPGAPDPHKFGQAGTLSAALRDAAFRQVREDSPTVPYPWPGPPEEFWEFRRESPTGRRIERMTPEQRKKVMDEIIESWKQYYDGQQVNFTAVIVVASGVR